MCILFCSFCDHDYGNLFSGPGKVLVFLLVLKEKVLVLVLTKKVLVLVLVLKKYGGLGLAYGLGLETQSLGLGLDKKVLFTSLPTREHNTVELLNIFGHFFHISRCSYDVW